MNSLVQLLTNKETFFFREMHQFEVLRDQVLPEFLATRRLRNSWHPGLRPSGRCGCGVRAAPPAKSPTLWPSRCSSSKRNMAPSHAEIIGTDIDASALEIARRGCYGERALRLVPADWRERYFAFDGRCYRVAPEVARRVQFPGVQPGRRALP